jgi:hypothetical protein
MGGRASEEQLSETIDGVVLWGELEALIEPYYHQVGNGHHTKDTPPPKMGINLMHQERSCRFAERSSSP